jgi:hypothetical protein
MTFWLFHFHTYICMYIPLPDIKGNPIFNRVIMKIWFKYHFSVYQKGKRSRPWFFWTSFKGLQRGFDLLLQRGGKEEIVSKPSRAFSDAVFILIESVLMLTQFS